MRVAQKKLPLEIKNIAEYYLCHINEIKKQLSSYKLDMIPSPVPSYSGMPGSSDPESRPTEKLAVKISTDVYVLNCQRIIDAYDRMYKKQDKINRDLIKLVFTKQEKTVEGASMELHLSKTAGYDRIRNILWCFAVEAGFINL